MVTEWTGKQHNCHLSLDGFYNWNFTWTIVLGLAGMMNYHFLQMNSDGPSCPSYWGDRGKDIERSRENRLVCQVALNKEELHNGWEGLSSSLQVAHHWRLQLVMFVYCFFFSSFCLMPMCKSLLFLNLVQYIDFKIYSLDSIKTSLKLWQVQIVKRFEGCLDKMLCHLCSFLSCYLPQ